MSPQKKTAPQSRTAVKARLQDTTEPGQCSEPRTPTASAQTHTAPTLDPLAGPTVANTPANSPGSRLERFTRALSPDVRATGYKRLKTIFRPSLWADNTYKHNRAYRSRLTGFIKLKARRPLDLNPSDSSAIRPWENRGDHGQ